MTGSRERVLSGMRPTGQLHLGNYLGALENWVKLQDGYECFYFVANWHVLTTDPGGIAEVPAATIEMGADWLGAGLAPEKSTLFIQPLVPEHAELHLLFSMCTPVTWLERVPTYKEMVEQLGIESPSYGLLGYPLLQSADILMYKAQWVPVGADQVPHIELTREVARRFNHTWRSVFRSRRQADPDPEGAGTDGRKMSKSYGNAIYLSDSSEEITAKIKPMVTDPARKRRSDPAIRTLSVFDLHRSSRPTRTARPARPAAAPPPSAARLQGRAAQAHAAAAGRDPRAPATFVEKPQEIVEILYEGSKRARRFAQQTMQEVHDAVKLEP